MINIVDYASANKAWDGAYNNTVEFGSTGRNLIKGSNNIVAITKNGNTNVDYISDGGFDRVLKASPKVVGEFAYFTAIHDVLSRHPKVGEKATLSLLIRGIAPDAIHNSMQIYYNSGTTNKFMTGIAEEYQWLSVTFDVGSEVSRFHIYPTDYQSIYVAKAKLEIGARSTEWTPAPEDLGVHPFVARLSEIAYESKVNKEDMESLRNAVVSLGGSI